MLSCLLINARLPFDHRQCLVDVQVCADMAAEREELKELLNETRQRNTEQDEQLTMLTNDKEKLMQRLQDLEDQ